MTPEKRKDVVLPPGTYVAEAAWGNCKVCGGWRDLRCGACFTCSDQVAGELVAPGIHKLWDKLRPQNTWFYREDGNG